MRDFRRSHSEPRRRRTFGGDDSTRHFYDSYTDRLVRDVVRLTFFGGDNSPRSRGNSKDSTPAGSPAYRQASPVGLPCPAPGKSHTSRPRTHRPRPSTRRISSPLTIYSSGYESDAVEYMITKEEEIDALLYNSKDTNVNHHDDYFVGHTKTSAVTDRLDNIDALRRTKDFNRDEFVLSPDDLYIEEHSSFTCPKSTPSKHQRHSDLMRTCSAAPIKSDLNSPGRERRAHQGPIHRSAPIDGAHSAGKSSSFPGYNTHHRPQYSPYTTPVSSPNVRKLSKVNKSMQYIISNLDATCLSEEEESDKKLLNYSVVSETPVTKETFQVPLTSTPVPTSDFLPTVTYCNYVEMIQQRKLHEEEHITENKTFSSSMSNSCEHQSEPSNIAHLTHSCPSTLDNDDALHNRVLHTREGNQAPFEHQPLKLFALTSDNGKRQQFDNGRDEIKECSNQRRGLVHSSTAAMLQQQQQNNTEEAVTGTGHLRDEHRRGKTCLRDSSKAVNKGESQGHFDRMATTKTTDVDGTFYSSVSSSLCEPSTMTTTMLQSEINASAISLTDLVRDSVKSIRIRPKDQMFDEDYYLRPRTLEFNSLRSSGSESSLPDGTLLLKHLQNSEFWNSQKSSSSSLTSSLSPRDSTVSSDSGRGSTSAMDINELRCESDLDNSFLYDADSEPIYETIPDHLVSDENNDSDATLCEDFHAKRNFTVVENTYATIDGDTPEGYTMCSSFNGYSPEIPPVPPARNSHSRMTFPTKSSSHHQPQKPVTRRNSRRHENPMSRGIKRTDIISNNPYHVYTVGDILESFHRLASNIPSSPPRKEQDSCYNVPTEDLYAEVRKPVKTQQQHPRHCDINTQRHRRQNSDIVSRSSSLSLGHRGQSQGHQGQRLSSSSSFSSHTSQGYSSRDNKISMARSKNYTRDISYNSHYRRAPREVETVTAPLVRPVWKPSVSQLQGSLC